MKIMHLKILLLIYLLAMCGISSSYNILVAMVAGTPSHMNFFNGVVDALIQKNHNVTFISSYKTSVESSNLRKVLLKDNHMDHLPTNLFGISMATLVLNVIFEQSPKMCPQDRLIPEVQEVVKEDFDVLMLSIYFADCYLSVAFEKKIPFIYINPNILMDPFSEKVGLIEYPSVSPGKAFPFNYPMTFKERMIVAVFYFAYGLIYDNVVLNKIDTNCREANICPSDMPHIRDFERNSSLTIINSIKALEQPVKQTPPNIIYAGGIHIKPNKTLPKDLQDWMDASDNHGVILFSLGTAVKASQMKKEHFQVFLNVFKTLKQRVLWKWDLDTFENLPPNVRISKWLPQQDILAHPKTVLFITHGGLFSTIEAIYYEVPVIGMPVFGDQKTNIGDVVNEGWGKAIQWESLTEKKLLSTITDILADKKLVVLDSSSLTLSRCPHPWGEAPVSVSSSSREALHSFRILETVKERSKLMNDRPQKISDEVTFWVEYVIRHNGAHHLRSPFLDMSWYQIHNIDVWFTITLVIIGVLFFIFSLVKFMFKCCINKLIKVKME